MNAVSNVSTVLSVMKGLNLFLATLALAAVSCGKADTVLLNQLVDEVLASANEIVAKAGKSQLPITNVGTNWSKRWHFIHVSGSLTCDNGQVGQLNTLKRTGDASMTTAGDKVTLKANLGLGDFSFHFDTCRAKVHHILSVHSKVDGKVDSESISFQLSLTYNKKQCSASLDSISLDTLGKIELKTGGGVFHKVIDKLLDAIANHLRGDVRNNVNKRLKSVAQAAVTKNSAKLCQKIPH